jgi:DNA helicase II / ATP-dependent DNA helicase PcrA
MTLHTAKGLEYPVVFLVGHGGRGVPARALAVGPEQLEEERRLAYVGHDPRAGPALPHPRRPPHPVGRDLLQPAVAVPRRAPRRARRGALGEPGVSPARRVRDAEVLEIGGAEFHVGDDVLHTKFGEGRIAALSGEGERAEATVDFDRRRPQAPRARLRPAGQAVTEAFLGSLPSAWCSSPSWVTSPCCSRSPSPPATAVAVVGGASPSPRS